MSQWVEGRSCQCVPNLSSSAGMNDSAEAYADPIHVFKPDFTLSHCTAVPCPLVPSASLQSVHCVGSTK